MKEVMYPCHLRSVDERLAALRADSHMVAGGGRVVTVFLSCKKAAAVGSSSVWPMCQKMKTVTSPEKQEGKAPATTYQTEHVVCTT